VAEFAQELGYKNQSVVPIINPAKTSELSNPKSKSKKTKVVKKTKQN
jgi:hypothetical protein